MSTTDTAPRVRKPVVYIASPYTKGDVAINVRFQMETVSKLMDRGLVIPVAPLLSHFLHIHSPRPYRDWIEYDLELLNVMDALLRLPAEHTPTDYLMRESSGADGEERRFVELGKPVFYCIADMNSWAVSEWPSRVAGAKL
jgi:hypothetical protein